MQTYTYSVKLLQDSAGGQDSNGSLISSSRQHQPAFIV
jgi:hypothetical protein